MMFTFNPNIFLKGISKRCKEKVNIRSETFINSWSDPYELEMEETKWIIRDRIMSDSEKHIMKNSSIYKYFFGQHYFHLPNWNSS